MKKLTLIAFILGASVTLQAAEIYTNTAYCNNFNKGCVTCNGKWSKYNRTADGHIPTQGVTIAAPRSIPFGTKVKIEGLGTRVVQDRLSKKYDNRIDVYFNSHKDALKFGKKTATRYRGRRRARTDGRAQSSGRCVHDDP